MWEVFDTLGDGRPVVTYRHRMWAKIAARVISHRTGRFFDYEEEGKGY